MIDFVVIGAQKGGTTALYEYLKNHPEIALPVGKEAAYFLQDLRWTDFYARSYSEKNGFKKIGSISPHYMCEPSCALRMKDESPELRIVAILRDPLSRAYSHYKMNVRRKYVDDSFDNEVLRCSSLRHLADDVSRNEADSILYWGEYGRILREYFKIFSSEQILLVDYANFKDSPAASFKRICQHLQVSSQWAPVNLGKKYHVGGRETILPPMKFWAKIGIARTFWKLLVSDKLKAKLRFWYEVNNVKSVNESAAFSPNVKKCFIQHYKADRGLVGEVDELYKKWFRGWEQTEVDLSIKQ
jgi:hypothetical protein